mmetsp:Transcript_37189/g.74042  ORF Transcript_37189/g.74042 Transcript_37189/m.74042 type:complete len:206 (+) Transcript_37189:551-1168(+)
MHLCTNARRCQCTHQGLRYNLAAKLRDISSRRPNHTRHDHPSDHRGTHHGSGRPRQPNAPRQSHAGGRAAIRRNKRDFPVGSTSRIHGQGCSSTRLCRCPRCCARNAHNRSHDCVTTGPRTSYRLPTSSARIHDARSLPTHRSRWRRWRMSARPMGRSPMYLPCASTPKARARSSRELLYQAPVHLPRLRHAPQYRRKEFAAPLA